MSTICSMIQGCGPFDQFKVETVKTRDFPPSREMRIGVAPFGAPAVGVSKYSVFGPAGDYTTPENAGMTVAHALLAALKNVPGVILAGLVPQENISNKQERSPAGYLPDAALPTRSVDARLIGDVTCFQSWYDMAGGGGIVSFDARLIHARTAEELFSVCCTAVRRSRMPEHLVHDLAAQAVMKLLEE